MRRMERPGSEQPGIIPGLDRQRNALPRGAAVRGSEDAADVAARPPVVIAYQPAMFRVGELYVAEAEAVIRRVGSRPDQLLDASDLAPFKAAVGRFQQREVFADRPTGIGVGEMEAGHIRQRFTRPRAPAVGGDEQDVIALVFIARLGARFPEHPAAIPVDEVYEIQVSVGAERLWLPTSAAVGCGVDRA